MFNGGKSVLDQVAALFVPEVNASHQPPRKVCKSNGRLDREFGRVVETCKWRKCGGEKRHILLNGKKVNAYPVG